MPRPKRSSWMEIGGQWGEKGKPSDFDTGGKRKKRAIKELKRAGAALDKAIATLQSIKSAG